MKYRIKNVISQIIQLEFTDPNRNDLSPIQSKIEIVDSYRIRVYFFKHHNILDEADEFHRTSDLTSFDEIMAKILKSSE